MGRRDRVGNLDAAMDSTRGAFASPPAGSTDILSISGTAAAQTGLVQDAMYRLRSTVDCFLRFADTGDATTTTDMPLQADKEEWLTLQDCSRISAITSGSSGSLYITRMG